MPPLISPQDKMIKSVNTSIALFVGRALWGPANTPFLCSSYTDFEKMFSSDTSHGDLARAVRLFFLNGGTQCYVARIFKSARSAIKEAQATNTSFTIKAKYPGKRGNTIHVDIKKNTRDARNKFDLKVYRKVKNDSRDIVEEDVEWWQNLSMNISNARHYSKVVKSLLVNIIPKGTSIPTAKSYVLSGGSDSLVPGLNDYLQVFETIEVKIDLFNLLILPRDREHKPADVAALWAPASELCQKKKAFLLIDPPDGWQTAQQAVSTTSGDGISALRQGVIKDQSAVFFPKIKIIEGGKTFTIAPAGAIAGLLARVDATLGVWKNPAGNDAILKGVNGVELAVNNNENGLLNQRGINAIRVFAHGPVNWGARTLDGDDALGSEWKYIAVRRTALFIEESIYRGLNWITYQPNDQALWTQVRLHVTDFMQSLFMKGAFQGQTPKAGYYVKCDTSTNMQNDVSQGRLNVLVAFAPIKPAEFITLKIEHLAGQRQ